MLTKHRLGGVVGALVVALGLSTGTPASALTLADLQSGGSFTTTGGLSFSDFDITVAGDLAPTLSLYTVAVKDQGFDLVGPIAAVDGEIGTLSIQYTVSSGAGIAGASLFMAGSAGPTGAAGAKATVTEAYRTGGGDPLGSILTFASSSNPSGAVLAASLVFGSPQTELRVTKGIVVDALLSGGLAGGAASIPVVEQRFSAIPEPGTLLMFAGGVAGLAFLGRRRPVGC